MLLVLKFDQKLKYHFRGTKNKILPEIILHALKVGKETHSSGPFTRSDFKDPILGSENWKRPFRHSDFKVTFLWRECRKVIYNVFTRSDFQNWQRIFNLAPKRSQGYHAKFVGSFHPSRRVSIKREHVLFSSIFFKRTNPCVGRSSSICYTRPYIRNQQRVDP